MSPALGSRPSARLRHVVGRSHGAGATTFRYATHPVPIARGAAPVTGRVPCGTCARLLTLRVSDVATTRTLRRRWALLATVCLALAVPTVILIRTTESRGPGILMTLVMLLLIGGALAFARQWSQEDGVRLVDGPDPGHSLAIVRNTEPVLLALSTLLVVALGVGAIVLGCVRLAQVSTDAVLFRPLPMAVGVVLVAGGIALLGRLGRALYLVRRLRR